MSARPDGCTDFRLSSCCNAEIILGDICSDCREHCGTMCDDCEETGCEYYEKYRNP